MVKFKTSTGWVAVQNWGYALQGINGKPANADLLASATHDLLVIDSSRDGTNGGRFFHDEIARMKDGMGGRSVVVSYISIGEAFGLSRLLAQELDGRRRGARQAHRQGAGLARTAQSRLA
ncbi:uncharacterized protein (TIGR01370 family) [Rhizobium subbaraonis]|uniref:Uncharacterized protein (TIGR01370 family) n=1 Tax=Rhizobium subbaraonis TaxID=908946 RepID=A0A285UEH9_9HYPH|nr:hypothetical protein [Rhizobium subbaraonis]SOC40232.1 uncharacterized protein (TIGR01370 family) [Rhizobium subbaraonis]